MGNLILRRKAKEAIVLNNIITIRVLGVEGERVKLSIQAPDDVQIVREELLIDAGIVPPAMMQSTPRGDV